MTQPPRLADWLLKLFCALYLLEEVQGFQYQVRRMGAERAPYWRDVLGFPFAVRKQS